MKKYTGEHQSVLFALIAQQAERKLGSDKLDVMSRCTIAYSRRRGRRMAKRAIANGDSLTMEMFTVYNESAAPGGRLENIPGFEVSKRSPVYENKMHACGNYLAKKRYGLERYAIYFCPYVDYYYVKGFNPELEMDCIQTVPEGVPFCHHRWNGFEATEENWQRMYRRMDELGDSIHRDELYHTADLYYACRDTIAEEEGMAAADAICRAALDELRALFPETDPADVLNYETTDFEAV